MSTNIQIQSTDLDVQFCSDFVTHEKCGGIAIFVGTVRDKTAGKNVLGLSFEAYEPMAIKEMEKIAQVMVEKWSAQRVCIHHRIGDLNISDIAVIIAVSTPHRAAAFEACQYGIDTLKETVPIWKKERFDDGDIWVAAHP